NESGNSSSVKPRLLNSIGTGAGLSTKLLEASADYLIDRTKQELTIAFFDKFRRFLGESDVVNTLLPNTYTLLTSLDDFQIPSMGKMWVQAFDADLRVLPLNLERYVLSNQTKYEKLIKSEEFQTYLCVIQLIKYQELGMHPASIFELLANQYQDKVNSSAIAKSICRVKFISNSLRDTTTERTWIDQKKLGQLKITEMQYFIALLFLNHRSECEQLFIKPEPSNFSGLYTHMLELSGILDNISKSLETVQEEGDSIKTQMYTDYRNNLFELLGWGLRVGSLGKNKVNDNTLTSYFTQYKPIIENTLNAVNASRENKQGMAFIKLVQLMNSFSKTDSLMPENTLRKFVFYCNFMVDITTADSTTKLKDVLQKYAMPVVSYQIKRKSKSSLEIGAFPGTFIGWETITNARYKGSWVSGITAPLGLTFSLGNHKTCCIPFIPTPKEGNSYSIFLSLVDIGAVLTYRWEKDTASGLPGQIKWQQLFSPGLHFVRGFKNVPLSLMYGMQYTPLLRKIEKEKYIFREFNSLRFCITLSVDIPMFTLFRKPSQ
ncbi:MAG: hypothetical protein ACK5JC_10715, partial [Bacteroidota bacterium]